MNGSATHWLYPMSPTGEPDQRPSAVRLARHHVQVLAGGLILH